MAMANRRVLSGSAVRGRAASGPAALGEAEQRSRAAAARKEAAFANRSREDLRSAQQWRMARPAAANRTELWRAGLSLAGVE